MLDLGEAEEEAGGGGGDADVVEGWGDPVGLVEVGGGVGAEDAEDLAAGGDARADARGCVFDDDAIGGSEA